MQDKRVFIKPLKQDLKPYQNLKLPKTAKDCMSFAGVVNYLSNVS